MHPVYDIYGGIVPKAIYNKPGRKQKLHSFDKSVIQRAVLKLYERKIPSTCANIKEEIKDNINVSRPKMDVALLKTGFKCTKRGDDRHVLRVKIFHCVQAGIYVREYRNQGLA